MGLGNRFKSAIQGFITANNAIGQDLKLSREFWRHGNRKPMVQDWSQVLMTDQDLYTGYSFAAINNRATAVAELAMENLKTNAKEAILNASRKKNETIIHPYIDIIDQSDDFADYFFWYTVPTYLDLRGVYYLLAVRTVEKNNDNSLRVGNIQEFKMLNPYEVRRIRNENTLEIGGYVEVRDGMIREIPPQMIIEIRRLNPFSRDDPFALSDAIKDSQFTLKQAGDYTRHSLKNNMAAPGIISTDVKLDEVQFKNFVARVTNQEKGLPLFGDGAGSITWDSMQIDMDKAALDKINEINRSVMFAASGVGKTMMAIEEAGTTRETAKVARDNFIRQHGIPLLRWIVDALNQDYKKYYKKVYKTNGYKMYIDSPLGVDRDAEIKDIQIRKDSLEVYSTVVNKGYDHEVAAKYSMGDIGLDELGEPSNEPVTVVASTTPASDSTEPSTPVDEKKEEAPVDNHVHHTHEEPVKNQFDEQSQGIVNTQQGMLQNTIVNIEGRVVNSVINKVTKNQFEDQSDIISREEREAYESELEIVLAAFYAIIIPLYASSVLAKRANEFNLFGDFKLNSDVREYIKSNAKKASESHINTILGDLLKTIQVTNAKQVQIEIKTLLEQEAAKLPAAEAEKMLSRKITPSDDIYKLAQRKALEGSGQQEIINALKKEYAEISETRAKTIARTEVNRAFSQSQYQADVQFIKQNGLESRAYKQWVTRSGNPCPLCLSKAAQPPIPFDIPFASIGDEVSATYEENGKTKVLRQKISYETVWAGNLHVSCSCIYQLIIKDA